MTNYQSLVFWIILVKLKFYVLLLQVLVIRHKGHSKNHTWWLCKTQGQRSYFFLKKRCNVSVLQVWPDYGHSFSNHSKLCWHQINFTCSPSYSCPASSSIVPVVTANHGLVISNILCWLLTSNGEVNGEYSRKLEVEVMWVFS